MTIEEPRIHLRWHAVSRFIKRWRPELAERDARRELYWAFKRAIRIAPIDGGVLYETDDQERIPIVVREHKAFGVLIVTVLPENARHLTDDDYEDLGILGRLGTEEQPKPAPTAPPTTIPRSKLTAEERLELAKIEKETALLNETIERLRLDDQSRVISELRERVRLLQAAAAVARPDVNTTLAVSSAIPEVRLDPTTPAGIRRQLDEERAVRLRQVAKERAIRAADAAHHAREEKLLKVALRAVLRACLPIEHEFEQIRDAIAQVRAVDPALLGRAFLEPTSMTHGERRAENDRLRAQPVQVGNSHTQSDEAP